MVQYETGKIIEEFKYHQEEVKFDINDCGATLLVFYRFPTQNEIEQFEPSKDFKIKFMELYGVIMISVKIGNLSWMDAPYTPHLSRSLTKLDIINEGQGLALTVVLVDAVTGEVKKIRFLSLPEKFSRKLFIAVLEQKGKKFDIHEYGKAVKRIHSAYTIKQIVKMSSDYR